MANKLFQLAWLWAGMLASYIILAVSMPAHNELVQQSLTSLNASADMSNFPGTYEAVAMYPVYAWFIPGLVTIVLTTVMLLGGVEGVKERVSRRIRGY